VGGQRLFGIDKMERLLTMAFLKNSKLIIQAARVPEIAPVDTSLWRRLLLKPILLDIVSVIIQIRQASRISRIEPPDQGDMSPRALTFRHNLSQIVRKPVTRTRRVERFYQIATSPYRVVRDEKVLVIGGRSIHEFYEASLYGFSWKNIYGADLFSSHPKILENDMHNLKFSDGEFDVVMMINTLGYSTDPAKAISEAMRVLKVGGRFVFNHVYIGRATEFSRISEMPISEIVGIIRGNNGSVYHYDPVEKTNSMGDRQTSHNLGIIKINPENISFDRLAI
jgi:SAM-dependent methyltransferase